jgi:hypothetical protein
MSMCRILSRSALALVLLAGASVANAQSSQSIPKEPQNAAGHQAQQTPSGQGGKEEPGSHASIGSAGDPNAVFVNGALDVPGAPPNTDTVPAKFSTKNAADDKLITVAYTFKILPHDQRQAIYQALKDTQPMLVPRADIGNELPTSVELRAVPGELAKRVPHADGYLYAVSDQRVMLVSPATRIVVAVYPEDDMNTVGSGNSTQ